MAIFPRWLHYLDTCPSTNTWALEMYNSLDRGDVVFTRRQTAGRGQQGRSWFSPEGVMTASFYLDRLPTVHLPCLSLLSGLAVIYAVEDLSIDLRDKLQLKWTNDIMLAEGKLAGILCEAITEGNIARVVIGVGLNLCVNFADYSSQESILSNYQNFTSLDRFTEVPDEIALLEKIRHYLLELSSLITPEKNPLPDFLPELNRRNFLFDRQIIFRSSDREYKGKVLGIDDRGGLLIRTEDDRLQSFISGRAISWCENDR